MLINPISVLSYKLYNHRYRIAILIVVIFFFLDFMWPLGTLPDGEYYERYFK